MSNESLSCNNYSYVTNTNKVIGKYKARIRII